MFFSQLSHETVETSHQVKACITTTQKKFLCSILKLVIQNNSVYYLPLRVFSTSIISVI